MSTSTLETVVREVQIADELARCAEDGHALLLDVEGGARVRIMVGLAVGPWHCWEASVRWYLDGEPQPTLTVTLGALMEEIRLLLPRIVRHTFTGLWHIAPQWWDVA